MTHDSDNSGVEPDTDLLPELQATAADLRAVFVRDPEPEIVDRHLAAMASAVRAPVISLTSRRHRVAVAGAVVAVGVLLTGGLAAAGVLPAPVQNGAARLLHPVGIEIPRSDGGTDEGVPRDQDPVTTTTVPQGVSRPDGQDGVAGDVHSGPEPGSTTVDPGGGSPGSIATTTTAPPGQSGSSNSRSSTAPGQTGSGGNNKPAVPPGQVDNPGHGRGNGNGKSVTTTSTTVPR